MPDFMFIVIIGSIVTLVRLLVLHHYVDWKFLWGGDQVPVLNPSQLLKSIFSLEQPWRDLGILFIPQLTLISITYFLSKLVSGMLFVNPLSSNLPGWIVNSLWFFMGTMILWYVVTSFNYLNRVHKTVSFIVISVLFGFNPWATLDTFKSYLGSTSIQAFLSFGIIAFYFRLIRYLFDRARVTSCELLFVVASIIILYGSPSSTVRGIILFFQLEVTFILLVLFVYFLNKHEKIILKKRLRTILKFSSIPLIVSISIFLLNLLAGYLTPLKGRVLSRWGSLTPSANVLYPTYATVANSFIGMTSWIAHSNYMPYHELYEKGITASLMFLWPLIALGFLLLILVKTRYNDKINHSLRLQVVFMFMLTIISISWGTALHPPFSFLKSIIVSKLPIIVKAWPWGMSLVLIKFSYIVFSSYVIGYLVSKAFSGNSRFMLTRFERNASIISIVFTSVLFLSLLLYTSLPIYTGKVFGQYYDENIKGFILPKDYEVIYNLDSTFYEHSLLLPETPTYTKTQWGFQGSVAWYHRLNNALLTRSLVPYSEYTMWSSVYGQLARPCMKVVDGLSVTQQIDAKRTKALNGRVLSSEILDNKGLTLNLTLFRGKYSDVVLPLKEGSLNISMYNAFEISLKIEGNYTATISPWLFVFSGRYAGAHILSAINVPGETTKIYAVGSPDKPWVASRYDPKKITGFMLRLKVLNPTNFTSLNVRVDLRIVVGNKTTLCKSYRDLLSLFNVKYIVMDRSLNSYNQFYKLVEDNLRKEFNVAYEGRLLSVYETNISTSPIHIIEPGNVRLKIIEEKPYHIKAEVLSDNDVKKIVIIVPFLYSKALPTPLKVSVHTAKGEPLKATSINYEGLKGYVIDPGIHRELIVSLTYPGKYIAIYLAFLTVKLAPLFIFLVCLMLNLKRIVAKWWEE